MSLPAVRAVIRRVRGRVRFGRLIAIATWACSGGAVAFGAAVMSGGALDLALLSGAVASVILCSAAFLAWEVARPLTEARVARLVDDRLGLLDLLSTAIEVDPRSNPVALALTLQAESRAPDLSAAEVVDFRWTKTGALLLAATLMVAVTAPMLRGPFSSIARRAPDAVGTVTADQVLEVASLAEAAAEAQRDPHLAAVARALQELVRDGSDGETRTVTDTASLTELLNTLDRLSLPGARQPLLAAGGGEGESDGTSLESALARLEKRLTRQAMFTGLDEEAMVFPEENWQVFSPREGDVAGDATQAGTGPVSADLSKQGTSASVPSLAELSPGDDIGTAELLGASSDSSAGGSSLAGLGTQDLFGDATAEAFADTAEAVKVDGTESSDGRRVTMGLAPDASGEPISPEQLDFAYGRPRDLPDTAVSALPPRFGSVAATYFLPSQETVRR